MRPLKNFQEFLESGIVSKRAPNSARARALIEDAKMRKKFIDEMYSKICLNDGNANYFIENVYDILIGLIRAKLLSSGLYASGEGAHEAEVSFMLELGFSEKETRFMNELRYFRNGILYYGKRFSKDYAEKVLAFLERQYTKLRKEI